MVDYTREIQATQASMPTPVVQQPTGNLVGDIANLATTGIQLFAQQQGMDKQEKLLQAQSARDRAINKGAMSLLTFYQQTKGQEIPRTEWLKKQNAILRGIGDEEMQSAAIKLQKQMSGETSFSVMGSTEKAVSAQEAANTEAQAYASAVLNIPTEEVNGASQEQLDTWKKQADVMNAQIAQNKAIIEISDDITAPVMDTVRVLQQGRIQTELNRIRDLQRAGNVQQAQEAGTAFRGMIMEMVNQAPTQIRNIMDANGKGSFYDGNLVSTYTQELLGILESPTVKDVLSGREVDEQTSIGVRAKFNTVLSQQYFKHVEKVSKGEASPDELKDFQNIAEFFTNKDISGAVISKGFGETVARAFKGTQSTGGNPPPPKVDGTGNASGTTVETDADVLFSFLNSVPSALKGIGGTVDKTVQLAGEYWNAALGKGKEASDLDINAALDMLSFGQNGTTDNKGKGASKLVLEQPLTLFNHEDYQEKVAPKVKELQAQGIDMNAVLLSSLDNHIRNNFRNAYTNLLSLGTSGQALSPSTGMRKDPRTPSFYTQSDTENLGDIIEMGMQDGKLKFKYKKDTLGQMTDVTKINKLASLNKSLSIINQFIGAMANVNEVSRESVGNEVMYLLARDVNIPLEGTDK